MAALTLEIQAYRCRPAPTIRARNQNSLGVNAAAVEPTSFEKPPASVQEDSPSSHEGVRVVYHPPHHNCINVGHHLWNKPLVRQAAFFQLRSPRPQPRVGMYLERSPFSGHWNLTYPRLHECIAGNPPLLEPNFTNPFFPQPTHPGYASPLASS